MSSTNGGVAAGTPVDGATNLVIAGLRRDLAETQTSTRRGLRQRFLSRARVRAVAVSQWHYADIALAHTRLGGVPSDRVVNTWPLDRLLDWAAQRSKANSA